jgi:hypothetical protein
MSGVVLRCPNCGTTKSAPGECEACHEAQVRYFCMNHTPGRWLDAPTCPQCGARFGEPARPPAAPPPRAPARAPAPDPASTSTSRRRGPTSLWPKAGGGPWSRRLRPPSPEEELGARDARAAAREALRARFPDLLRAGSRVRRMPSEATHVPGSVPIGLALGGCLLRLMFLAVVLLIALAVMSIIVGGSMLQFFGVYF